MGFSRGALVLEWPEGSEFFGLEVRMRRLSIEQLTELQARTDLHKGATGAEVTKMFDGLLDAVNDGLLSWNYEQEERQEDGSIVKVAVPANRKGLGRCDVDMVLQLVRAWRDSAAGVPLDSRPSSPTGEPEPPDAEWASYLATSQESLSAPVSS